MTLEIWMYFPPDGSPITLGEWNKVDGWDGGLVQANGERHREAGREHSGEENGDCERVHR